MKAITYNLRHVSKNQHDNPEQKIVNLLEQMSNCLKDIDESSNSMTLELIINKLRPLQAEAIILASQSHNLDIISNLQESIDSIAARFAEKRLPEIVQKNNIVAHEYLKGKKLSAKEPENNIAAEIIQDFYKWSKGNKPLISAIHSALLGLSPSTQDIQLFKQISPYEHQYIKNRLNIINQLYKDNIDLFPTQLLVVEKEYTIIANFIDKIIIFNKSIDQNMIEEIKKYNDPKFNNIQSTPDKSDISKNQSKKPPSPQVTNKPKSYVQALKEERENKPRTHNRSI